jgi:phosphatidylserine/phosphatidylglycerophosphate/cardiolipin synthase-like enzyme
MTDFANGKIQAFVGPQELGAAHCLGDEIVKFIEEAQHTLDIAIQEIDSEPIAQAILDARYRGVRVNMIVEQDYVLSGRRPRLRQRAGETIQEAQERIQWTERRFDHDVRTNRDILNAFLRCNIDVKADYNTKIFHQKFVIRDYTGSPRPTSAVLTGSTNFTHTGTHKNLNNVIIFHHPGVCRRYRDEFREIRSGRFGRMDLSAREEFSPINIDGVPVRILFAPDDAPEFEIVKQMLKCQERLDFAIFTFSGSSGIDDALIQLRQSNHAIRGAVDPMQGRQSWAATPWLHDQGIDVFMPVQRPGFGKLHHKLMVIDEDIVIAGSMNYTKPANEYNDENVFVLGSPYKLPVDKGGPVDDAECARLANFFRDEIDRIIADSDLFHPDDDHLHEE